MPVQEKRPRPKRAGDVRHGMPSPGLFAAYALIIVSFSYLAACSDVALAGT
jgi:hypothetical protein